MKNGKTQFLYEFIDTRSINNKEYEEYIQTKGIDHLLDELPEVKYFSVNEYCIL